MSQTKFTPGPWFIEEWRHSVVDGWIIKNKVENDKHPLTYIGTVRRRSTNGTAEANARLIAAAPEMYEFIQGVLDGMNVPVDFKEGANYLLNKINQ